MLALQPSVVTQCSKGIALRARQGIDQQVWLGKKIRQPGARYAAPRETQRIFQRSIHKKEVAAGIDHSHQRGQQIQ